METKEIKIIKLIDLTMDLTLLRMHDEITLEESNELVKVRSVLGSEYFFNWLCEAKEWPATPKGIISMIKESWI